MGTKDTKARVVLFVCVLGVLGVLGGSALRAQMDFKQASGIPRPVDDLPAGTISIRVIRGDLSNPIVNHPVELRVGDDARTQNTDAEGRAEFIVATTGTVRASTVVDGERLESQAFPAPGAGAVRMLLVASDKEAAARAAEEAKNAVTGPVVLGRESEFVLQPGDESVTVYYLLEIVNTAQTAVHPPQPFTFDVPRGAQGAAIIEGPEGKAVVKGQTVLIQGPFRPGKTTVQVAYALRATTGSVEVQQRFPAELEHLAVIVRKFGDAKLTSPNISRQQEMPADGQTYIAAAGDAPIPAGQLITLNLDGLPHHSLVPRYVALSIAALIVLIGIAALRRPVEGEGDARATERKRLIARREKLLQDVVKLEQDHRRGRLDAARYGDRRQALMEALEHVYGALDGGDSGVAA
jgi:hypothetical protein